MLVIMETDGSNLLDANRPAIKFAQELCRHWQMEFDLLAIGGPAIEGQAELWRQYGARQIWVATDETLVHPTADRVAVICSEVMAQSGATTIVGAATTFGKDVLPRAAELRELPMVSDVMGIAPDPSVLQFNRAMYAGNVIATVELAGWTAAFTVRPSAFRDPEQLDAVSQKRTFVVNAGELPMGTAWIGGEAAARKRPELTAARAVVSGGRPLRDSATFERLIGGLADALHGSVGATRAAVDSGIAPNELQIGQTGKVVAPDLYIAAGISGSVQHLAGMKDSRVIVAINTDPEAPIFSVADYGLVADLHRAIPEIIEAVQAKESK